MWSKKVNGPTIRRALEGKSLRTSNPPRSRGRASITVATMRSGDAFEHSGSIVGWTLMRRFLSCF
jgi:hypothetical protein